MAWAFNKIGLGRARLLKLQQIVQAGIPNLNASLHYETALSNPVDANNLLGDYFGGDLVASKCVTLGVPLAVWQPGEGFLRIGVVNGDPMRAGTDGRFALEELGQGPSNHTWTTSIMAIFHPHAVRVDDPTRNTELEVVLSTLVSDWLRADVLNAYTNTTLYLPSQEVNQTPYYLDGTQTIIGYDRLAEAYVRSATVGPFALASGSGVMTAYSIHMQHQAIVSA